MNFNVYTIAARPFGGWLTTKVLRIMKLTTLFLIIALVQVSAKGYSQKITLDEKNKSLEQVFHAIEKQSAYVFFYDNKYVKATKVNVNLKNASIEEVLNACFGNLPLTYNIVEKNIVITPKDEHKTVEVIQAAIQKIQGKVTDTTGGPIPGVTVKVKGSSAVAVTDVNGKYSIAVPNSDAVLVFSYVGYLSQEIKVGDRTTIDVALHERKNGLNEIVIVGYGSQSKAQVTGAISTVKMGDVLADRPVSTTSALLLGVVPGLQVTIGSGQPGSSTSLNIRGGTDLNASGNNVGTVNTGGPLILVDNVPFNGGLNLINPDDIETISVLKDAGSAAIYGGRSAFGVVLITMKKGKKSQKVQFQYSNNVTFANAVNLPVKATPSQFLQSLTDMGTVSYYAGQNVATWTQLENQYQANPSQFPGGITTVSGQPYQLAATNVLGQLLGSYAPQFQNNFSVSGGSENTTFRASLGSTNENGIIDPSAGQDKFSRYTVNSILSTDVNKWLTTQFVVDYSNSLTTTPSTNQFQLAENFPTLTADTYYVTASNGTVGISGTPKNVISTGAPNLSQTSDIRLTGRAIVKPFTGLTITGEYTYDGLSNVQTDYSELTSLINPLTFIAGPYGTGIYEIYNDPTTSKSLNIYGNYVKSYHNHNFSLLAGYNQESNVTSNNYVYRSGMIAANLPSITQGTGPLNAGDGYSATTLQGYFGRFSYDYKGKYLLQVNGRYDGSSNFPPNHRFGFFPSASVGWRIIDEDFMNVLKPVLSELKLRASIGTVGNQNIGAYSFIPVLNGTQPYWLNGTGAYLTSLSSPGIISSSFTWEKVQTINYGVDFGLFANRLTGSFDLFRRTTSDILAAGAIPLPAVLGTGAPLQNTASLQAKGFEVQINWKDKIGQVRYSVGANVYDSQSTVTKFDGNPTGIIPSQNNSPTTYYVGQKLGDIWGYTSNGFYSVSDFVPGSLNSKLTGGKLLPGVVTMQGELPNPGDVKFKDLNGDGVIYSGTNTLSNPGDRKIIGNSTPRYQFGANGSVGYKSFDFTFVLSGVAKQDLNMINALTVPNNYTFATIYQNELNYWTPTNTNPKFGRIYDQGAFNQSTNQTTQTSLLSNGAYLRINNLALAYTLPNKLLSKVHINSLRVFCSVENPFLFDYLPKGVDPTLTNQAYGLQYPFLRKTSFGANLTF